MKVLYISQGGPTQDYLRDAVFHGLRSLLGPDVVDVNKLDSMYQGADRSKMYGMGFTLYALLPDIEVDRTDIYRKIANKYFNLIIYGSIHRCQDYLHEVASQYRAPQCVFLDGEDHPGYLSGLGGLTFKRELHNPQPGCLPIQFGIPKEKIIPYPTEKTRTMAPCDPIDKKTYIYKTEAEYYSQYASSLYGATMKKAGYDCLRHYEIISQWCLPYFRCLEVLPPTICQFLPRKELRLVQLAVEYYRNRDTKMDVHPLEGLYRDLIGPCVQALRDHMTTEAVARYVLDKVGVREVVCS